MAYRFLLEVPESLAEAASIAVERQAYQTAERPVSGVIDLDRWGHGGASMMGRCMNVTPIMPHLSRIGALFHGMAGRQFAA